MKFNWFFSCILFFCTAYVASVCTVSQDAQYVLMIPLYNEPNPARIAEYIFCFARNMQHHRIEKIHVIYDTSCDDGSNALLRYLQNQNCIITYTVGRPTYTFCFDVVNELYPNKKIILANADIFFNKTLELLDEYDLTNQFLALTRWDVCADKTIRIFKQYDHRGRFSPGDSASSQDVWIFKTPLRKFQDAAIQMGTMTCDSLIAYQAYAAGLIVRNPCLSMQCCHLHISEKKQYDPATRVTNKPIRIVPWETLY